MESADASPGPEETLSLCDEPLVLPAEKPVNSGQASSPLPYTTKRGRVVKPPERLDL